MTPSLKRKRVNRAKTWQRAAAKLVLKKGLSLASKAVTKRLKTSHNRTKDTHADEHPGVKESSGGASVSRYTKLRKGPKRAKNRPFDTNIFKEIRSALYQGSMNSQSAFFNTYWDYADVGSMLQTLFAQVPSSEMAPLSTLTLNQMRPYFLSARAKFTWSNMASSQCWLTIYDIHCKDSNDRGPVEDWKLGMTQEEGDIASGLAAGDFALGTHPHQSKRFKRTWKIDKTTRVFLRPGEQHAHFINHGPHKAMDNSTLRGWNNTVSGSQASQLHIGGLTRAVMWTTQGTIAVDRGAGAVSNQVGTTSSEIALVYDVQYKYSMLRFPNTTVSTASNLVAFGATPTFINEDTSAPVGNAFV